MNQRLHYLLVFLLLLNTACTYKLSGGDEFVKVEPPTHEPALAINLNFMGDTLYIPRYYSYTFTYTVNGDPINWAQFVINGKSQVVLNGKYGPISLMWWFNDPTMTTCPLELKIFTKSLSGSIADKMGVEGYMVSKKWTLIIKEPYQLASKITKADFVDGSLKLEWDMYKGVNFTNYKVYKTLVYGITPTKLIGTITSQQQTSIVDNTYHGEDSKYYVVTNDNINGGTYLVKGPLPASFAGTTTGHDFTLSWEKAPYYKNLKGYGVCFFDNNSFKQPVGEVTGGTTESMIFSNPMFAFNYNLYLSPLPLTDNYYDDGYVRMFLSSRLTTSYGVTSPTFRFALAGMAPVTYLMSDPEILVFDHITQSVTRHIKNDEIITFFDVSANNQYLICMLNTPRKIYFEDLTNPANNKKIDFNQSFPLLKYRLSVSNIATGVLINSHTLCLYDFLKQIKLAEIDLINNGDYYNQISASGNFFFCDTYLGPEYFQYINNQIIRLPSILGSGDYVKYAKYMPGTNEKLIRVLPQRIEVLDCKTWTVEKQWSFPNPIYEAYNLDLSTGKIFLLETDKLTTFNVFTGAREELATTKSTGSTNHYQLFYNQGQILWGEGKSLR